MELTVILIGLWRALEVGTLHAYHSIRIELAITVSPISLVDAGTLFARNDTLAIAALPIMYLLGRMVGLRALLVAVPLLSVAAILAFATMATPGEGLSSGTHASLLCMAARMSTVLPCWLAWFTAAPWSSSAAAEPTESLEQARMSGVAPSLLAASTLAPYSSRRWTSCV